MNGDEATNGAAGATREAGYEGAYIAHLWQQPRLCIALFGVQFHTPAGQQRYEGSGIPEEMEGALTSAQADGLLLSNRRHLSFYHEIYQAKTAEAVFERGCLPVGPAIFTATSAIEAGEGRSKDRQERFADAASHA